MRPSVVTGVSSAEATAGPCRKAVSVAAPTTAPRILPKTPLREAASRLVVVESCDNVGLDGAVVNASVHCKNAHTVIVRHNMVRWIIVIFMIKIIRES